METVTKEKKGNLQKGIYLGDFGRVSPLGRFIRDRDQGFTQSFKQTHIIVTEFNGGYRFLFLRFFRLYAWPCEFQCFLVSQQLPCPRRQLEYRECSDILQQVTTMNQLTHQ